MKRRPLKNLLEIEEENNNTNFKIIQYEKVILYYYWNSAM